MTSGPRALLSLRGALVLVAAGALIVLLAVGLAMRSPSTRIDDSLASGKAVAAPEFELPALVRGEGEEAPAFVLPALQGGDAPRQLAGLIRKAFSDGSLALSELRGTPLVINFWASWCVPCREEAPVLEDGWLRDQRRGVLYVGLNMQDLTDDARDFMAEFGITYPNIRDQGNDVARDFGATGIPETYFIDRRGRVVAHAIGVVTPGLLASGVRGARRGQVVGQLLGGALREQR
jgi:cytochrome c biogenesis protein CcmG, thiol:disulfide interchange protein DsbE